MNENNHASGVFGPQGRRSVLAASWLVFALVCGAAQAREVGFPKDHPKVALDVPDGWTLETTPTGLEIRSPEKDSIVVLQIVGRQKAAVESWTKEAGARFKAFGVDFAKDGAPAPKPGSAPAASTPPTTATVASAPPAASVPPAAAAPVPSMAMGAAAPNLAPSPTGPTPAAASRPGDAFTFSGAPSLSVPGTAGSNDPVKPGALSLEALTAASPKAGSSRLSFKTVAFFGTSMHGNPVDAELAIYTLSKDRVVLLMQESRPEDNRSVAIARSVRRAKGAVAQ